MIRDLCLWHAEGDSLQGTNRIDVAILTLDAFEFFSVAIAFFFRVNWWLLAFDKAST